MAKKQARTDKQKLSASKDVKQLELSFVAGGNAKWYSHVGKQFIVSYKLKLVFNIELSIPQLDIHPRKMKTYIHLKICSWMFKARVSSLIHSSVFSCWNR